VNACAQLEKLADELKLRHPYGRAATAAAWGRGVGWPVEGAQ